MRFIYAKDKLLVITKMRGIKYIYNGYEIWEIKWILNVFFFSGVFSLYNIKDLLRYSDEKHIFDH